MRGMPQYSTWLINQLWFGQWHGLEPSGTKPLPVPQIIWNNVDKDLWCHMELLAHNDLNLPIQISELENTVQYMEPDIYAWAKCLSERRRLNQ